MSTSPKPPGQCCAAESLFGAAEAAVLKHAASYTWFGSSATIKGVGWGPAACGSVLRVVDDDKE